MSRATSGSAPSFTVRPQVVWNDQRWATPSFTPLWRTASRTWRVMSTSSDLRDVFTLRVSIFLPDLLG